MKKMAAAMIAMMLGCALSAAEMTLDGNFQKLDDAKNPIEWKLVAWSGYRPDPVMQIVEGVKPGTNALQLTGGKGKHGFSLYNTQFFNGKAGQLVKVSFYAKGTGWLCATITCKNGEKKEVFSSERRHVKLSPEWKEYTFEAEIKDGANGKAETFTVLLNGSNTCECAISAVKVSVE